MARTNIPVNQIQRDTGILNSAVTPVTGDSTNNHSMANNGETWIEAHNTNGASTSHNVVVHISETVEGQAVTSKTFAVPAGDTRRLGPFPVKAYGNPVLIDVNSNEFGLTAWQR
jgi:hypothetical protein